MSYVAAIALLIVGAAGIATMLMFGIHKYRHWNDDKRKQQQPTTAAE